jgi:hypothetical protein
MGKREPWEDDDQDDDDEDGDDACPGCGAKLAELEDEAEVCVLCGDKFVNRSAVATQALFTDGTAAWWSALTKDHAAAAELRGVELVGPICWDCATVPAMGAARARSYAADLRVEAVTFEQEALHVTGQPWQRHVFESLARAERGAPALRELADKLEDLAERVVKGKGQNNGA